MHTSDPPMGRHSETRPRPAPEIIIVRPRPRVRGKGSVSRLLLAFLASLAVAAAAAETGTPDAAGTVRYWFAFLRPNPDRKPIPEAEGKRIMAAHMANIQHMADEGILLASGPMGDPTPTIRGIFILVAPSLEEARRIVARDPTVAEGRNTSDVHAWLGPEGLGTAYFKAKKEHPESKDAMATHVLCLVTPGEDSRDGDTAAVIASLRDKGVPSAAGLVVGEPGFSGILIFKGEDLKKAADQLAAEPAVAAGRLRIEYHLWWTADGVLPW